MWPPFLFVVSTKASRKEGLPLMTPHRDLIRGISVTYGWT
jgi:hypothetical protein